MSRGSRITYAQLLENIRGDRVGGFDVNAAAAADFYGVSADKLNDQQIADALVIGGYQVALTKEDEVRIANLKKKMKPDPSPETGDKKVSFVEPLAENSGKAGGGGRS